MLRKFSVTNYKNFGRKFVLDLGRTRNYSFNENGVKDGTINKAVILGKNGSGKTNLGLALFDIVVTLTDNAFNPLQKDPGSFLNGDSKKAYAEFEYEFMFNGKVLRYIYRKTAPHMITYECLSYDDKKVFMRNEGKGDYKGLENLSAGNLRMNVGNGPLSIVRYVNSNTVQPKDSPIAFLIGFVERMLYFKTDQNGNGFIGYGSAESITDYIINNGLIEDFKENLREFASLDMNLESVAFPTGRVLLQTFKNKKLRFDAVASSGTSAFMLYYYWKKHFENASFVYMDEFDAYYHFEMAERILKDVISQDGFQTIFTTHNTSLISNSILRPDCYFVINERGVKQFSELTEREIRAGHNLEKLYLNGEFDE